MHYKMEMKHLLLIILISQCALLFGQTEKVKVYFELEKDELTTVAKKELNEFLALKYLSVLEIVGFSDSTGSEGLNLQLSKNRAKSVESYLLKNGLDSSKVAKVIGEGETTTHSELKFNRVVIINYVIIEPVKDIEDLVDPGPDRSRNSIVDLNKKEEIDHLSVTRDGDLDQSTIESLKVGEILNLGGIEFQPGRHILTKRSYKPLDKLIDILKDNPDLKIEIQGHICCQAQQDGLDKDTGTMNLSENRAKTVYTELIKAGIDRNRLTYKGYGPFRKLAAEIDDNSRQRNRRVSIQVLEK